MRTKSNVTDRDRETQGLFLGALGVLAFSFSLPATRVAVEGGIDPWLVAFGRSTVAAVLAVLVLAAWRGPRPTPDQWRRLLIVAAGVVVGFPLATSLALEQETASHGIVVVGLLPAMTACAAVLRAGERPSPGFWAAALAGLTIVVGFALATSDGGLASSDLLLVAGNAACALGYAEGGALARDLGGARTICWALIAALPLSAATAAVALATSSVDAVGADAWAAFAYVSVISMFLGFFAWYAGLARGGVAKVGQVQLAQPILGLVWAGLILGEHVGAGTAAAALGVLGCVVATQRARVARAEVRGGDVSSDGTRTTRCSRPGTPIPPGDASASA